MRGGERQGQQTRNGEMNKSLPLSCNMEAIFKLNYSAHERPSLPRPRHSPLSPRPSLPRAFIPRHPQQPRSSPSALVFLLLPPLFSSLLSVFSLCGGHLCDSEHLSEAHFRVRPATKPIWISHLLMRWPLFHLMTLQTGAKEIQHFSSHQSYGSQILWRCTGREHGIYGWLRWERLGNHCRYEIRGV